MEPKSFLWSFCGTHLERSSFSRVKVPLGSGALKFQVGLRIFPRNPRVDFEVLGVYLSSDIVSYGESAFGFWGSEILGGPLQVFGSSQSRF